jgi:nitrate/TMAO reductase-like tetraheme cytochrome c subunit
MMPERTKNAESNLAFDKKKKCRKRLKILLIGLVLLFVFLAASIEVTSSSKFCSVCHYMKPFYQSWKSSSHAKIECKVCHYPPGIRNTLRAKMDGLVMVGRYWTKLYLKSKPWAEIQDESCLQKGCHDRRLLEGRVSFKTVVFDHKAHFSDLKRGKQLRCTSCHSQIVQGEHITVTESSCFLCHFKKTENYPVVSRCTNCHKEDFLDSDKSRYNHRAVFEKGFACDKCHSQVILGDDAVPRENCYKCHFEKEWLDLYGDTDLIHKNHISLHKIECDQCHLAIQHKIVRDVEAIADCQTCHTGSHQAQKILFSGVGGKGVDHPMPNVMFEKGLSCKGCHMFHEESGGTLIKSSTSISGEKACESCHGTGFSRILRDWEASTRTKLHAIRGIYQRAVEEIRKGRADIRPKAESLLKDAAFNIDVVDRGKSVHNMTYAQELLKVSLDKIEEALKLAGSAYAPERILIEGQKAPNACLNCHTGIEEISTQAFGMAFPHKSHVVVVNLPCSDCHSNAKKHGEFIGAKSACAACHHKETKKECTDCHVLQKTMYEGGTLAEMKIPKDPMAEAETACTDCHLNKQKHIIRPAAAACVECHGEEYRKTFEGWHSGTQKSMEELRTALAGLDRAVLSESEKNEVAALESVFHSIESDESLGFHNHTFVEDFLTNALKKIKSWGKRSSHG